ncbi:hypothetical protein K439DRAFT_1620372 [Ramaria rubella]|nr:hypothetical protein K439DRAFT_1620372 [Ramaria rubella]
MAKQKSYALVKWHGCEQGESLLLVQLITASIFDENPKYTLREIQEALLEAQAWHLLPSRSRCDEEENQDPLNLLPLLVPSNNDAALDMIVTIARQGNAKETVIAMQESVERLQSTVRDGEESGRGSKIVTQLIRLVTVCGIWKLSQMVLTAVPRLRLRKKGPSDTLRPVLTHLGAAVVSLAPLTNMDGGRSLISAVSSMIQVMLPWLYTNVHDDDPDNKIATACLHFNRFDGLLSDLLYVTLGDCANYIHSSLAQRRFEAYNPRLVLRSAVLPDSERGKEVMRETLIIAKELGITSQVLASDPHSFGKLVLLAHEQPIALPTNPNFLQQLVPILTSSIQQNIAVDESLALLLGFLSVTHHQLSQEIVDPLAMLLTPIASTHSHPPTRHVAFRLLGVVLSRAPPPVHLAHLSSLLSDCPFPQMRVAAVGLVKEAFLTADTFGSNSTLFKSATIIRTLGPVLFTPDPQDLFMSPSKSSLHKFLESSEPARLTECLAFYYVLLKRDTTNSSGIRDRDVLRTVENGLLAPLRRALAVWLAESPSMEDHHALMPLASLETSLERVDAAVMSLP